MIIEAQGLQKLYRTDLVETTALDSVDFCVDAGQFVSIMGPSGCGKSTLLHILGLIDTPNDGSYRFLGEEVARYPEGKRATIRKRNIGFVFQSFNLIEELTVYENIELPLSYRDVKAADRQSIVAEVLDRFHIVAKKDLYPSQLSGGQQQLVGVARAVAASPSVVLADEPTGNLHSSQAREIMELFKQLNDRGTTIVQVTHSEENARFGGRIIRLRDGFMDEEA
jgi:putative ABC transport system ATP-binding protein